MYVRTGGSKGTDDGRVDNEKQGGTREIFACVVQLHISLGTRRLAFSSQSGQVRISNLFWLFMSIVCVDMKFIVQ